MFNRVIRLSCELPILFSNNPSGAFNKGPALSLLPGQNPSEAVLRADNRCPSNGTMNHVRKLSWGLLSSSALEVSGVLCVPASDVLCVFGIGA